MRIVVFVLAAVGLAELFAAQGEDEVPELRLLPDVPAVSGFFRTNRGALPSEWIDPEFQNPLFNARIAELWRRDAL